MKRYLSITIAVLLVAAAVAVFAIATRDATAVVDDPNAPRVLVNRDKNGLVLEGYDPGAMGTFSEPAYWGQVSVDILTVDAELVSSR